MNIKKLTDNKELNNFLEQVEVDVANLQGRIKRYETILQPVTNKANVRADMDITGLMTFVNQFPITPSAYPTADYEVANKIYVDDFYVPYADRYTDEKAQDAVGGILTDTASIDFTYDDIAGTITADVLEAGVDHNLLKNYVYYEHIDHSGVVLTAGNGLTGGGDITVNRTIDLDTPGTLSVSSSNLATGNHTHAITSSANPGAAASILASDVNGYLQLVRLGLGISPSYPLHIVGESRLDGDLNFVGAQQIGTTDDSLTLAPAADLNLTPGGTARVRLTSDVRIQSDNYASQTTGWGISYAGSGDFRYLYADELHAKAFVADLEQSLAGGQIICKSVAPLASDFTVPAAEGSATLVVESFLGFESFKVFVDGDIVRLRQFDRTGTSLSVTNCWGTVTWVSTDTGAKTQTYTFTRSAAANAGAATEGSTINAGSLALDYGTTGNGFLESNAIDGAMAEYAPYHQVVTWTTHPDETLTVRTRLGNLKGIFNVANEYGLYAGAGVTDSDQFLRISNEAVEAHNLPLKMYDGASVTLQMTPTIPSIQMGGTLPTYDSGTGLFAGKDDSVYKLFLGNANGNKLLWDGTNLSIVGSAIIGNGVGFTTDALLYLPFDGPRPHETDFQVNTNGHLGQQATVSGGVIGRPGKFGKAVQVAEATTNLIVNPIFENNVTDGYIDNISLVTRITTDKWIGSACCKIELSAGETYRYIYQGYAISGDTSGRTFTGQVRIKAGRAEDVGKEIRLNVNFSGSATGNEQNYVYHNLTEDWVLVTASATCIESDQTETRFYIYVNWGSADAGRTILVDAVQYEEKAYLTPLCYGDMGDGHSWSGTAHNSTSSRTATSLTYPSSGNINVDSGSVSAWFYVYQVSTQYNIILWATGDTAGNIVLEASNLNGKVYASWGTTALEGTTTVTPKEWHHVILTYDGTTLSLYLDGEFENSVASSGFEGLPSTFRVGARDNNTLYCDGYIDDFAILDRALTADEVKAIYESNAPLNITTNKFELMLTGAGKGKVWGHAGGLFAQDASGNAVFALANEDSVSWSGQTIDTGDLVLGKVGSGAANIFWDHSTGKFHFRENTTTQVEIGTDGALYAGGGDISLDSTGITSVSSESYSSSKGFKFKIGGTVFSYLGSYSSTVTNAIGLRALPTSGKNSNIELNAEAPLGEYATIYLGAKISGVGNFNGYIRIGNYRDLIDIGGANVNVENRLWVGDGFVYDPADYTGTPDMINILVGSRKVHNGIRFYETSSFHMSFGYDGSGSGNANKLVIYDTNNVNLIDFEHGGNLWIRNNCSALSFTDRTPFFEGDALAEISKIKGKNGRIDHSTLPAFARSNRNRNGKPEEGRNISAMISMHTVAIQQLMAELEALKNGN